MENNGHNDMGKLQALPGELEPFVIENNESVKKESHIRSIVKGISWRIVGTTDTIIIATFITHDFHKAFSIGAVELLTKVFLFYLHERVWMRIPLKNFHLKSLIKGIVWRGVAFGDTFMISYFVTHSSFNATSIAGIELFTKIPVFYLHERLWRNIKWGQVKNKALPMEKK